MTKPGWIGFALRTRLRGEAYLAGFSDPASDVIADMAHKHVAIVGNARSLSDATYGAAIDSADIVIRMHKAPLIGPDSHGQKTDWLALGMPIPQDLIATRNPSRLLWMAKKRKRLRPRLVAWPGFYLHPVSDWQRLVDALGAPPSTGAMIIDLAAQSQAAKIELYGFDFFASRSLSGSRTAAQVPHDFAAEREFVMALAKRDARVHLNSAQAGGDRA